MSIFYQTIADAESGEGNSVRIETSSSRFSDSASVLILTRYSAGGHGGGDISLKIGTSANGNPVSLRLESGDRGATAGAVEIASENASDDASAGGSISVSAGSGFGSDGGNGGDIVPTGG